MDLPTAAVHYMDVMEAMKAGTALLHRQVDEGMPLSRERIAVADYHAHLRIVRAWLARSLQELELTSIAYPASAPEQLRLLDADLAALAGGQDQAAPDLPCGRLHEPEGEPYLWGVNYTIEGSRLGALFVAERVQRELPDCPVGYLQGGGAAPGAAWNRFRQAMREHVRSREEIEQALKGAMRSFESLILLLPTTRPAPVVTP